MTQTIIRIIVGRTGRRLPEIGGLPTVWSHGILADYYHAHPNSGPGEPHVRKCLNGDSALSHQIIRHYTDAYDRILRDTRGIAQSCASLSRLQRIQAEVRDTLPVRYRDDLAPYYHPDATREQVAVYLARALQCTYQQ